MADSCPGNSVLVFLVRPADFAHIFVAVPTLQLVPVLDNVESTGDAIRRK